MSKKRPNPGGNTVPEPEIEVPERPSLTRIKWVPTIPTGFGETEWRKGKDKLGDYDCHLEGAFFVIRHPQTRHEIHIPASQCMAEYDPRPKPAASMRIPTMADAIEAKRLRTEQAKESQEGQIVKEEPANEVAEGSAA